MDIKMLKCGCAGQASHTSGKGTCGGEGKSHPTCIVHDCCVLVAEPNFKGRKARCAYYGKAVKTGSYNGNCCGICKEGGICQCEGESSPNLWFFVYKPEKEFDEYYCACHGAD